MLRMVAKHINATTSTAGTIKDPKVLYPSYLYSDRHWVEDASWYSVNRRLGRLLVRTVQGLIDDVISNTYPNVTVATHKEFSKLNIAYQKPRKREKRLKSTHDRHSLLRTRSR